MKWNRLIFTLIAIQERKFHRCHSFSSLPSIYHPLYQYQNKYNQLDRFHNQIQGHPLSRLRHRNAPIAPALTARSEEEGNDDSEFQTNVEDNWKVGDLESDLQILRLAVAKANAQTSLEQMERLELLDEFARQRRELIPDVRRYILGPLVMGMMYFLMLNNGNTLVKKSALYAVKMMDVAFWTVSVLIPLAMYYTTRKTKVERRRKSEWSAEFIDPREDCSDCSRCILENISSSALPSLVVGLASLMMHSNRYIFNIYAFEAPSLYMEAQYAMWKLASLSVQLMARLGSASSMYQFPKLQYELKRSKQQRPTPWLPSTVKSLVDCSMCILPFGFAADLAQVCASSMHICKIGKYSHPLFIVKICSRGMVTRIAYCLLLVSLIAQTCHLVAFKKLFRIGKYTNISLAMSNKGAQRLLEDDENSTMFGFKLRYRLNWREPKRISSSFRFLGKRFLFFIFSGWGDDSSIVEQDLSKTVPHILKLVKKEMDENPGVKVPDRSTWIPSATRRMARIHQENYDNKTFEDPLGIAFQQTFGIGISFDFDHQSKLNPGETPSIHRLRARAAKSAIRRYNEIPKIVKDYVSRTVEDPSKRKEEEKRLIKEEREKLMSSAHDFIQLIPSNAHAPEGKDLDVLSMRKAEADALVGKVNLPFLVDDEDDIDDDYAVDPYLGDNIFLGQKTIIT